MGGTRPTKLTPMCRYGEHQYCANDWPEFVCPCRCHRPADELHCPHCDRRDPTTEHLVDEWRSLTGEAIGGMFRENARRGQDDIAHLLFARGITAIPNVFGAIDISLWYPSEKAQQ